MKINIIILLSGLLILPLAGRAAQQMSVQVQTTQLRATPSYLGGVVATVQYADRVDVLQKQGAWMQVQSNGKTGWVNESALTKTRIELRAGAEDVRRTATGEEIALAGKGFNSQVEADFKAKNKDVDFTWIDRMETFKIEEPELVRFRKEGGLP